jgi:hypothetical protein
MSGLSGTDTTSSQGTQYNINQIPQWVQQAGMQNYGLAQQIATTPLQQYQGQMVADVGPQTQQAWNLAANSGNVGQGALQGAQAGYLNALANAPMNITATQANAAAPTVAQQSGLQQAALAAPTTAAQTTAAPTVNAAQAQLSQLANTNLQPYMNPYTQDVINKTLPIMNQSLAQQQNALQNQANASNAFGGSRQAIQQGVLGAQGALSEAQMAAGLNQANFAQAQQAGQFDVNQANLMGQFNAGQQNQVGMFNENQLNQVGMYNTGQANQVGMYNQGQANAMNQFNANQGNQVGMFNAGQGNQVGMFNQNLANQMAQFNAQAQNTAAAQNQAAQQAGINSDIAASQGLGNLGMQQQQANIANYGMLTGAGAAEQQQAQNQIQAQIAKFNQAFNYPQTELGLLESALGQTPYPSSSTGSQAGTQIQTSSNPGYLALQGLQGLGSLFGAGGAFASGGALAGLFGGSDRRIKKNITHLGKDPVTKVPIKAFHYKGQPSSAPKTIGPLAQDLEKRAPGSTVRIGGIMHVPKPTLAAATPSVAHLPQHAANVAGPLEALKTPGPAIAPFPGVAASPGVQPTINAMAPRLRSFAPRGGAGMLASRR